MVVRLPGEQMHLWRAVDHEGEVLDVRGDPHRKIGTPSGPGAGRARE
jgi:transposase-like protein